MSASRSKELYFLCHLLALICRLFPSICDRSKLYTAFGSSHELFAAPFHSIESLPGRTGAVSCTPSYMALNSNPINVYGCGMRHMLFRDRYSIISRQPRCAARRSASRCWPSKEQVVEHRREPLLARSPRLMLSCRLHKGSEAFLVDIWCPLSTRRDGRRWFVPGNLVCLYLPG